jgi:hypothetical protein
VIRLETSNKQLAGALKPNSVLETILKLRYRAPNDVKGIGVESTETA